MRESRAEELGLRRAAERGEVFDPTASTTSPGEGSHDHGRRLPAGALRTLFTEGLRLDPRGVTLRSVVLDGALDLRGVQATTGLRFESCTFSDPLVLDHGSFPWLTLVDCTLDRLAATGAVIAGDFLVTGCSNDGDVKGGEVPLTLKGAKVGGDLILDGTQLRSDRGPAVIADRVQVSGDLSMADGFQAAGVHEHGVVRLIGARIDGSLNADNSTFVNDAGPSLQGDAARVGGNVSLGGHYTSFGRKQHGGTRFPGAVIGGDLDCRGGTFLNPDGPSLELGKCRVQAHVFLSDGFRTYSGSAHGGVNMPAIEVGGILDCTQGWFVATKANALVLNNCDIIGEARFGRGFRAASAPGCTALKIWNGSIGGSFDGEGGRALSRGGTALDLEGARIGGQLRLPGDFACGSAPARSPGEEPAWSKIDTSRRLEHPRLVPPRPGRPTTSPISDDAEGGDTWWSAWLASSDAWTADGMIRLDGLTYSGPPLLASVDEWLRLLSHRTPAYTPQPYRQLATAYSLTGAEDTAIEISLAQQADLLRRGQLTWVGRQKLRLLGPLIGHGYRPARALWWLAALAVIYTMVVVTAIAPTKLVVVSDTDASCSLGQQLSYSVRGTIPLITTASTDHACVVDGDSPWSVVAIVTAWTVELAGWGLATLFVAGFTGLVRRA